MLRRRCIVAYLAVGALLGQSYQNVLDTFQDFDKLSPQQQFQRLDNWSIEDPDTQLVKLRAQRSSMLGA